MLFRVREQRWIEQSARTAELNRALKVAFELSGWQLPDALTLGYRDEFVGRARPEAEVVLGRDAGNRAVGSARRCQMMTETERATATSALSLPRRSTSR